MCVKDIDLCAQTMLTIVGVIIDMIRGDLCGLLINVIYYAIIHLKFNISNNYLAKSSF